MLDVREDVAMKLPAIALPCNVVEARDADDVAVNVPVLSTYATRLSMSPIAK